MQLAGVSSPYNLLGFYHGVPMTQRTQFYANVAPDTISIYRRPILAQCKNDAEARAMITRVVRHEVAHYFGIDDDRLVELGAY
jgi:predicted Zn-dependent protease with MMP-like domain